MVGLFAGLNTLGIGWKQFQWLAAAMTAGLSFGLKDIFANFVSGIIILFERPIRWGYTVTVRGSTGKVSRIRIRSTTITDWGRRE
jgi:potassium efflux system protein